MNGFKLNQLPSCVKTGVVCYLALVLLVIAFPFYMMSQEKAEEHAGHKAELRTGGVAYAHGVEAEHAGEAEEEDEKEEGHGGKVSEHLLKAAHVHLGGHTLLLFTVGILFAFTTLSCPIKGAVFVVSALSVALHTIGLVEMQVLGKGVIGGSVLIYTLTILFMIAAVLREMLMREGGKK